MIKLTNINKYYRQGDHRFHVLHDINLSVDQGELVAIIGESGSGKSTLINIIGFLDDDFSGTYFYEDHPIHDYTRKQFSHLRNQNVGFVFQNFKLIREATVAENVALPLLYAGKRRREIGDRVTAVLDQVGLHGYEDQLPQNMSGGQQQRVSIGGGIHIHAHITMTALLMAFGTSAAVGLIFGILPARQAANKNLIDILR
ncbi:ATP-binding cassette domain-containing protein [Limosilactobacillus pontis]|uniref:ATP-binding cassette domain-containing protein n=1 Tax=Limosilactobacillus pontis TaxID=35787 RepID=A0ABU7SQR0_9LACO